MSQVSETLACSAFLFSVAGWVVEAGEYCTNRNTGRYEYCSGYCCSTEADYCCSDWGWIAGVVVGGVIFIAIVGTIIFLICNKMKLRKSQTVHVQMQHTGQQNMYQSHTRSTRRPVNNNNTNATYTTNTGLSGATYPPPPPPYSQIGYASNPVYPPPPPYPGSPLPGSNIYAGNNMQQPSQMTSPMTSQTHTANDTMYHPPPVS